MCFSFFSFFKASELDGEIDLSTCYDVKEFPVQRNYGFQILVSVDVFIFLLLFSSPSSSIMQYVKHLALPSPARL